MKIRRGKAVEALEHQYWNDKVDLRFYARKSWRGLLGRTKRGVTIVDVVG